MKTLRLIAVGLLLVTGAAAQDHRQGPVSAPTPPQVGLYVSDEGRYSVMFPSEPKLSSQTTTGPSGEPLIQRLAMASDGGMAFMIGYFDYGSGVIFSLDKARDGMLENVKGTLLDEQSIILAGFPGRQFKFQARTDAGLEFIDRARIYDVKPRVYVVQCLAQKSQDGPVPVGKCERFFDSFRVQTGG
jgi:hypothetical protein